MQAMEVLMRTKSWWLAEMALCLGLLWAWTGVWAATPAELLSGYTQQSGVAPSAKRGQQFFTDKHGGDWSCASCHGSSAAQDGKHASTGKVIRPLAPAFNPERFTDSAKVEKWFKRNCKDVLSRECSVAEKADVMAWLISVKP
jgi:cytochrome c peroxidase